MNHPQTTGEGAVDPLVSEFVDDDDMADLIDFFVSDMSERISSLQDAWQAARIEDVRTIAHQLKGAGAGYGFQPVTSAAATLEDAIAAGAVDVDELQSSFDELILMCRRVAASSE